MALINTGPNYTRTGNGRFLTDLANKASFIPFIGGPIAGFVGMVDAVIEGAGWLIKGKPLSAATVVASGVVGSAVNGLTDNNLLFWGLNAGSGMASGRSMGTHARALTEGGIGMITGALGVRPQVLSSYPAGIGSVGGERQQGSRQFTNAEAGRRGQNANELWNQKMNGEAGAYVSPSLTGQRGMA